MKQYYECHVTFLPRGEVVAPPGWVHTKIDGDFNLGEGVKHYITRQSNARTSTEAGCVEMVENAAAQLLAAGHSVLRVKLEMVLYDRRVQ